MKCFIAFSLLVAVASAAPQFLVDTPEVNAAKAQFYAAYNAAVAATASAPQQVVQVAGDDNESPAALPYIHEEIEAEPYIHDDVPAEAYVHLEPVQGAQDVAVAAPVIDNTQQVYLNNPIQPVAFTGTCYNWRGEGVPCRTNFN